MNSGWCHDCHLQYAWADNNSTNCPRCSAELSELRCAALRLIRSLPSCGYDGCNEPATKEWMGGKYIMCDEHGADDDQYEDLYRAGPMRDIMKLMAKRTTGGGQ
jgi:hypothetical protein